MDSMFQISLGYLHQHYYPHIKEKVIGATMLSFGYLSHDTSIGHVEIILIQFTRTWSRKIHIHFFKISIDSLILLCEENLFFFYILQARLPLGQNIFISKWLFGKEQWAMTVSDLVKESTYCYTEFIAVCVESVFVLFASDACLKYTTCLMLLIICHVFNASLNELLRQIFHCNYLVRKK